MAFTLQQIRDSYKKLSAEAQYFITDNETTELIKKLLNEAGLNEEQSGQADSELLYALYGLQTLDAAIANIAALTNKKAEDLITLKAKLQQNIFSKYKELGTVSALNEPVNASKEEKEAILKELSQKDKKTEILKAVSATGTLPKNLPMVEKGEAVHDATRMEATPAPAQPAPAPISKPAPPPLATPVPPPVQPVPPPPPVPKPIAPVAPAPASKPVPPPIPTPVPPPPAPQSQAPKASIPTPSYGSGYPKGADPYREPIE